MLLNDRYIFNRSCVNWTGYSDLKILSSSPLIKPPALPKWDLFGAVSPACFFPEDKNTTTLSIHVNTAAILQENILIYNIATHQFLEIDHEKQTTCIHIKEKLYYTNKNVKIYDLTQQQIVRNFGCGRTLYSVSTNNREDSMALGMDDALVALIDLRARSNITLGHQGDKGKIIKTQFTADNFYLFSETSLQEVEIVDLRMQSPLRQIKNHVKKSFSFSPSGHFYAYLGGETLHVAHMGLMPSLSKNFPGIKHIEWLDEDTLACAINNMFMKINRSNLAVLMVYDCKVETDICEMAANSSLLLALDAKNTVVATYDIPKDKKPKIKKSSLNSEIR